MPSHAAACLTTGGHPLNWSETLKKYNPFHNYQSFSHWFSYHWKKVLVVAMILAIWIYYAAMPKDPDPDYTITWVGASLLSSAQEEALTQAVQEAGSDVNGDGEILVRIDQYAITFDENADADTLSDSYTYLIKLMNSIQVSDCLLYLMDDPEGLQRSTGILQYLDGTVPSDEDDYECANWEEMCLPLTVEGFDYPIYLAQRILFQDDEDPEELFPGAQALFDALTAGS